MPRKKRFKSHKDYLKWYSDYRDKNREKLRIYNREYNRLYRQKNGYKNEYNSIGRYPEKQRAREILRNEIIQGRIKRQPCEVCGKKDYIHAHHSDYSKPLEIMWLCSVHHAEQHKK